MDTSGTGEESPAGSSAWLAGAETTPHREVERRELQRRVRAAVAQLKPTEATPIWMIYFEEFTLAEVARLEGEPESTVRSRVRAGLKRLEKMLGDLSPLALSEEEIGWGDTPGVRPPNHLAFAALPRAAEIIAEAGDFCQIASPEQGGRPCLTDTRRSF